MQPASFAQALARGSDEALFTVSLTGRVLSWTRVAEVLLGFPRAEIVGRPLITLVVASLDVEAFQDALREAAQAGAARAAITLRRNDGSTLPEPLPIRLKLDAATRSAILVVAGREPLRDAPGPEPVPIVRGVAPALPDRVQLGVEVHRVLSRAFEPTTMAQRVARLLVGGFADWCAVDVALPTGGLLRAGVAHVDPSREAAVRRIGAEGHAGAPDVPRVFRTGHAQVEAVALGDAAPDEPDAVLALREAGTTSFAAVAIVGRIRSVGVLTVARADAARPFTSDEVAWLEDLARRFALEAENARLADIVQRSREESRLATERANLLQGLAAAISEALTPREVTQVVVDQCKRALGACGGAIAVMREATFEIVGSAGPAESLSNAWRRFPVHARYPLSDAGRSGELVIVEHLPAAAARYPHLAAPAPGVGALAAVPLIVDGRRTGALGLVFPARREFAEADRAFMRTIARVAADALERARLYDAERSARARASTEAARSGLLAEASKMLAASFDYDKTLQDVARLVVPSIADWCAMHVYEGEGELRTVAFVHADPAKAPLVERIRRMPPSPSDRHIVKVLQTGEPEIFYNLPDEVLDSFGGSSARMTLLRQMGVRSQMVLPLVSRGRTLGAMVLTHGGIRRFHATDLPLAEELARRVAMGLDNAWLYRSAQESEERYRLLIEGVQDHAFVMLDEDGRIASWNAGARRLLGYGAADALGKPFDLLYAPEDRQAGRPAKHLLAARRDGRSEDEGPRVRSDGSTFFSSLVLTALAPGSAVRGFSLLVRDLTEQRRAREALEHLRQQVVVSEKLSTMGTLVSGVAHEIRTPLTAMSNSLHGLRFRLDALRQKGVDEDATAILLSRLDGALEGIDRINRLVEDLRRFHRLPTAARAVVGLHDVVGEALNLFRAAHRGRVEVQAKLDPTPPLSVDRIQIQQAVLNLLQNASEAMPHGGRVWIGTGVAGEEAYIVVQDEGHGMLPDVRARMFEEFFTTKPDGTGLGLSIVRRIMEDHGASTECESEPGKGTQFILRFPVPPRPGPPS